MRFHHLSLLIVTGLATFIVVGGGWAFSVASSPRSSGLHLSYICEYLWFSPIAELELIVEPHVNGQQRVVLQGQAQGIAAWMDGHRQQRYESLIDIDDSGQLTTLYHQRLTRIDSRGRRIEYGWRWNFAHQSSTVNAQRLWGGKVVETFQQRRSDDCYGDVLSVFLAFKRDSKPLNPGERYVYKLFRDQGEVELEVVVEEREAVSGLGQHGELFWRCKVSCDADIFPAGCSELVLWCDEQRLPVRGRVSRFAGLGTVTATLEMEAL